ncbi:MAG TPA: family 1 glycosylhydrolase [Armatimonadota bacterium]|nr:family 1 glycosylhydrolase [Armatimonadota bacterium]
MFESFFLAGFECATGYNRLEEWIDQVAATGHDQFADEDYRLLRETGIRAARDGIRWPLVDNRGRYDFSTVRPIVEAGRRNGVEIIWDLFHYGYPDDLDPFSEEFTRRFADYCYAVAKYISRRTEGTCYFTPVNEPSYFSWAGGHAGLFAPHLTDRGEELKIALIRAAIQGINAIRAACPGARIVNADPLCRVVPPADRPELQGEADHFNHWVVFESWDMLAGRLYPELGGSLEHLDIVGINYYWTNQWELTRNETPLDDDDPRRAPFGELVRAVWERYGSDLLVTETSHRDEMRPVWMRELAAECERLLDDGVPLRGVCLYPILGMPEWHAQHEWTRMGLWDCDHASPELRRVVCQPMLQALREAQRLEGRQWQGRAGRPARVGTV